MVSKFRLDTAKSIENKEAISRTLEIANNYAGEIAIEVLPLDKIELDPENKRELILTLHDAMNGIDKNDPDIEQKKQDLKSLESLARTIQESQLINPIYVYRYGNKCRLIAGERRTLASAIAGKKEIIARIASQRPVGTKLRVLQWVENNERSELSLRERISSLEAILQEYFIEHKEKLSQDKITGKLLSDLTGISMTQARRYILLLQCDSDIRNAIDEGKLENIKLVELICSSKNKDQQTILLDAALSGKSFEFISDMKKSLESFQHRRVERKSIKNTKISLGNVKPNIVKIIIDSLMKAIHFEPHEINQINDTICWDDGESVSRAFKKITALIEKGS